MYLIGEPNFALPWRGQFYAPIGNESTHEKVLLEANNMGDVAVRLREEYRSIMRALGAMGIEFGIAIRNIDPSPSHAKVLQSFRSEFGCRLIGMPNFPAQTTLYPRDFATVFPRTTLVNPRGVTLLFDGPLGHKVVSSPFGEGGRILFTEKAVLVGNRFRSEGEVPGRMVLEQDVAVIREAGLDVGMIPLYQVSKFGYDGKITHAAFNDHLDRIGCLITGQDEKPHFVVDPMVRPIEWTGDEPCSWRPCDGDSLGIFRSVCGPMGITVHAPSEIRVPYSLNLLQFPDRRILMTSGDEPTQRLVEDLVGPGMVTTTDVPIRFFPVWAYAGIRCLVSEEPWAIMKKS